MRCHLSTGSPFGHHPRLSMGCPRRGQWVRTRDTQLNSIPAYRLCSCGYSRSLLRRSSLSHILYGMYAFVDTLTAPPPHPHLHRAASGGGAPCVTAGDTRAERGGTRGEADSTNLRRRRHRTESGEGETRIGSSGCCATPPVSEVREFFTYPRVHPSGITRG